MLVYISAMARGHRARGWVSPRAGSDVVEEGVWQLLVRGRAGRLWWEELSSLQGPRFPGLGRPLTVPSWLRVKRTLHQNVPSPVPFFQPLYSVHRGNFQVRGRRAGRAGAAQRPGWLRMWALGEGWGEHGDLSQCFELFGYIEWV